MWNVAKLGARNGPTPPTHLSSSLNLSKSSASSSYVTIFFSSLLFVIASFVSQTFLMPGLYIRSVFLWLHASEWKLIIYKPSEHASISLSSSFFLSLSPPFFFFSWHDPIMCASKENDIQPSWKWICAFLSVKALRVCVSVSVRG